MSYTVFALKWRPQNFDQIIGQPHIVNTLKSAIKSNRLAHAYLFAGPRGVGKTSCARILAKVLNCKNGPALNPCQECASCKEIAQGHGLDVIEIDGASNRGIDEIRALRENVKFSPVLGKFKIYIIDEVHMLTEPAFNALLKTLEEPPDFVKFIFATTHPDKIPATILSRCQRFDFRRIPVMEMVAQLQRITAAENIEIDKDVLFAIAKASDGALRDAESVLDQLVSFSRGKICLEDVVSVLGMVEQETLFAVTDEVIRKDARAALKLLDQVIDGGKDLGVFLNNLIEHFRNLMVANVTRADPKLIDLPVDILSRLATQAQAFQIEELFVIFNLLVNTQEMSRRMESLRIPLEIALVKLCHQKHGSQDKPAPAKINPAAPQGRQQPLPRPVEVKPSASRPAEPPREQPRPTQASSRQEEPLVAAAASQAVAQVIEAEPEVAITLDDVRGIWKNLIDTLGRVKMSTATYLSEGVLVDLEKNILTVAFPKDYSLHKESLETKENRQLIEKQICELSRASLRMNFILSKEVEQKGAEEDSFIRSTLDMFNARVIRKD
ncbi:MAG: DNA polymerase III subunit gamma/tau [Candidatus Omnitrophica bacterium]|nr:DNA polymerase III subunit gamma/tau [Candidatus Omnitrophota bacterium]